MAWTKEEKRNYHREYKHKQREDPVFRLLENKAHVKYRKNNPNMSEMQKGYDRKRKLNHLEKIKAREKVHWFVRSRKIKRGNCNNCGSQKTHAHHPDYSKPLQIVWLCITHHMELHRAIKN